MSGALEKAFLDDIATNIDDDTPRLVYADCSWRTARTTARNSSACRSSWRACRPGTRLGCACVSANRNC